MESESKTQLELEIELCKKFLETHFVLEVKGHKYECHILDPDYKIFIIHQKCNRCLFDIKFVLEVDKAAKPDKNKAMYTLDSFECEEYTQDIKYFDGTKLFNSNKDNVKQNIKEIIEEHFPTCDDLIIESVL